MKRLLVVLLFLISAKIVQAQLLKPKTYSTRVQLELGNYVSPQTVNGFRLSDNKVNTIGLGLQKTLSGKWYLKFGCQAWYTFQKDLYGNHSETFISRAADNYLNSKPGTLWYRDKYHLVDIMVGYATSFHHQDIYANAGVSYTAGINTILINAFSTGDEVYTYTREEKAKYFGPTFELGYNYHLAKNRINIGPSLNARYYPGQFSQYTLKLNMGYNFRVR